MARPTTSSTSEVSGARPPVRARGRRPLPQFHGRLGRQGLEHGSTRFAIGNADSIGEMLSSLLGEPSPGDANGVFRERAVALVGTLDPGPRVDAGSHKNCAAQYRDHPPLLRTAQHLESRDEAAVRGPQPGHWRDEGHSSPRDARGPDLSAAGPISANCRPTT